MKLTKDELNFFNKNGYLILRNFATKRETKAILDITSVHIKYKIEPIETEIGYHSHSKKYRTNIIDYNSNKKDKQKTIRRLRQVYNRDILFKNWMESKKIRPILKQIFNDTPVLTLAHHNSIMTKMPYSSTETNWHQDIRYWNFKNDSLLSVWLALDKENSKNGVLEFIPQSHQMKFKKKQFDKKEYFKADYRLNKNIIETKVSSNLNRGDIVLFHSKLLHRANQNNTKKPKISFVYTVRALSNPPLKNTRSSGYPEVILDN